MRGETVILAAGDFPRKGGEAWRLLAAAKRVIACDAAANAYHRRFRRWPDVIIGDLDSFRHPRALAAGRPLPPVVRVAEQETNDLAKAIRYCRARGWKRPLVLGATGRREDHTLGNVFRAMAEGVEVVTDTGRFLPFASTLRLRGEKGDALSVFATDPDTRMTSTGLVWPLDGVRFENLFCATLNRFAASSVRLTTDRPAFVYLCRVRTRSVIPAG